MPNWKALSYVFIPEVSEDVFVAARISHESAFEERDVEDGGVEVDELKNEHFEREVVVKIRLGSMHL